MVSILISTPNYPPLKYRCQIKTKLGMSSLHPQVFIGYVVNYVGLHVVILLHRMPIFE